MEGVSSHLLRVENVLSKESDRKTASAELCYSVIHQYFETLNAGDFQTTARLFIAQGKLYPPFEGAIVGQEAIAAYLEKEAKGITALAQESIAEAAETDDTQVKVTGTVQTSLFTVNASWHFVLNSQTEIVSVRLQLLAGLGELLSLKR
ncbi:MAG: SnoaL-like domain-containing protein [Leptolyngbyaceae cyanobacterium CRU_2_3]|nr:SnoaL-like domain-containing protein [Leptolyngbyaceae cyanobacterium CRU_2_3]